MQRLYRKRILLGVGGGIAAYKSAELVRRLRDQGAEVRVVMTQGGREFITPLTLQALSGHPVHLDPEVRRLAQAGRQLVRDDGAQLDHRVVRLALRPPGADHDARLVQREIGGVEEEDLAELRLERVQPEPGDRRPVLRRGDRQLQLDGVGLLHEGEELDGFLVRERQLPGGLGRGHRPLLRRVRRRAALSAGDRSIESCRRPKTATRSRRRRPTRRPAAQ